MPRPDLFDVLLLLGLAALAAAAGCAAYMIGGGVAATAGALAVMGLGFLTIGVQGKRGTARMKASGWLTPPPPNTERR